MPINFVFALTMINGIVVRASNLVLVLYALKLGATAGTVGVLASTFSLMPMLLAVTAGRMADRFGARWLLTISTTLSGLGMLLPYFAPAMPAVFVSAAMAGLAVTFFNVMTQNLVGIMSAPGQRTKNFSNYALMQSIGNLIGPAISGFSIDHAGASIACVYLALLMMAPAPLLVLWGGMLPAGGGRPKQQATGGVRAMLLDPNVRRTLITSSVLLASLNLYQFYMPVYARSVGLSASIIGVVLAINSAAAFVVRGFLPRLVGRFGEEKALVYAFYMGAASLLAVPFFENAVMLALLSFIFGLGMGGGQPIINMLMFSNSTDGRSGEALGLKMTVNNLSKLTTPMLFGAIASAFGLPPIFWVDALALWVGAFFGGPPKDT
jgi:MFS family permease